MPVIDLSEAFVEVGRDLTLRVGLADRVEFLVGDALSPPVPDRITAGPGGPVHLPVPWARDPAHSHLWPAEDVREMIAGLGFREVAWEDGSAASLEFTRARVAAAAAGPQPLGVHLVLGDDYGAMFANQVLNLEEGASAS